MTEIYFASNRNIKKLTSATGDVFGDRFNARGPQIFRVGVAQVARAGGTWQVGQTRIFAENLAPDTTGKPKKLGSTELFGAMQAQMKAGSCDVVVYLHGFNTSFAESVASAAALQDRYSTPARPVMVMIFSWPSDGRAIPFVSYPSDREDAEASGIAMGRALMRLTEFLSLRRDEDRKVIALALQSGAAPDAESLRQCRQRLHVVAHSMGAWALRHAIQKFIFLNGGRVARIFASIFLMAADEDADALEVDMKLGPLETLARQTHIYHARNDFVLELSDKLKPNPDRLGADGPRKVDGLPASVLTVDCREVSETPQGHRHRYFIERPEVIADVRATLGDAPQTGRKGRVEIRPGRSWRLLPAG